MKMTKDERFIVLSQVERSIHNLNAFLKHLERNKVILKEEWVKYDDCTKTLLKAIEYINTYYGMVLKYEPKY